MELYISNTGQEPIYAQITRQIKEQILSGTLTGGLAVDEKLPSVRALATQLSINPNTIQRAYNELEGEGYIYSVPGKGSFVAAQNPELRREEMLKQVETHLQNAVNAAKTGGVSYDEVLDTLNVLWED